jgi:hypothetical protein
MRPLETAGPRQADETIVLDIPTISLTPGEYHVDLGLWGLDMNLVDHVHNAAEFTVVPADVTGSGYEFRARDGDVFVPFEWEVRPSSEGRPRDAVATTADTSPPC